MANHLLFSCFIIASVFVPFNLADLTVKTYAHPSHPGKCVLEPMILHPGTVAKHPDMCAKVTCREGSTATVVTCPDMVPPPDCTLGDHVQPDAHYPHCCRRKVICSNGRTFNS